MLVNDIGAIRIYVFLSKKIGYRQQTTIEKKDIKLLKNYLCLNLYFVIFIKRLDLSVYFKQDYLHYSFIKI